MALKIGFDEAELREQIKTAGGYWNPDQKACLLSYKKVLQLGLERRMIDQKGVRLDGETLERADEIFPHPGVLQVGKRRFVRVK